jgi:serine/threonine protein kinase
MRIRCPFCRSLIESPLEPGAQLDCTSCGRKTFVPKTPFEPNCVIDDFVIQERVGSGSIGTVYKAIQLSLERQVALKILSPELTDPRISKNLMREARAAAKITHINLVQSFAVGEDNGICFMAMNYISGETLKSKLLREGRIAVDEALHIAQQVAEALYYAWHEAKLIHRDIKPDNIMITTEGVVKLTDLGLAINQAEWAGEIEISGSPSYMSPEQFAGESLDPRTDIYSLGITLYQMLSGELPFKAETFQAVAQQHFNEKPVPLNRLSIGIPLRVSSLVEKMLKKLPEDRFRDMDALIKEIWNVRQTTAPNKELIPNVHTISINRLEYQRQHRQMELAQSQSDGITLKDDLARLQATIQQDARAKKLKNRRDWLFWGMVTVFPVPFVILIVFAIVYASNKEPEDTVFITQRIEMLENRRSNPDIPAAALSIEAQRILGLFPEKLTPAQEVLLLRLKNHIAELGLIKLRIEFEEKDGYIKSLESQLKELLSSKTGSDSKMSMQIKNSEVILKNTEEKIAEMAARIKTLEKQLKEQEKQKTGLNKATSEQQAVYDKQWKNIMLCTLYRIVCEGDYIRAEVFLSYMRSQKGKEYGEWFNSYIEWVKHLRELEEYFVTGYSNVVGKTIEGRRITMINYGNIYFEEKGGVIKSRNWREFPPQAIYELLLKARPQLAGQRKVFDADVVSLSGNVTAPEVLAGRPCLRELCLAVIHDAVESILITAAYDKTQAVSDAENLLNRIKNTEFGPAVKARLGTLINQN